jgi:hypothetical protein
MEVGQGQNWGCSAKEKQNVLRNYALKKNEKFHYTVFISHRIIFHETGYLSQ